MSPFIGRLDDIGYDGMQVIREIRAIFDNYQDLTTDILAASIRTVNHVKDAAMIGADVATDAAGDPARADPRPSADGRGPRRLRRRLEEDRAEDRVK